MAGADRYAADTFRKAAIALQNTAGFMSGHGGKPVETNAREAAQMAEDARIIAYKKMEEEQQEQQRAATLQAKGRNCANA